MASDTQDDPTIAEFKHGLYWIACPICGLAMAAMPKPFGLPGELCIVLTWHPHKDYPARECLWSGLPPWLAHIHKPLN